MSSGMGILTFVVTLFAMVIFHEFGHFIAAKRFGIKVEEFFVGFGPRLYSKVKGETEFGLKAVLLGGYVRIAGMNPWQEIPEDEFPRTFGAKPAWQRAVVLAAGSFTHFVLAFLIFTVMFGVVGLQTPTTTLGGVNDKLGSDTAPAKIAGLKPGDTILSIDSLRITSWESMSRAIRAAADKRLNFEVLRDGRRIDLSVTPLEVKVPVDPADPSKTVTIGQIGVVPRYKAVRESPPKAVWLGIKTTGDAIVLSVGAIGQFFSPNGISKVFSALGGSGKRTANDPIGLVGAARISGQVASAGQITSLVWFLTGFIVFIGVINLAPLPPLDGGHLLVLLIEKISRRKVDMRKVIPVAGLVVGFFLILTVALLYLDIVRPVSFPFQ